MGDLTSGGQATTFFTVVGSQDPQITPDGVQGPALDLLDALLTAGERVTEVMLAWTPDQGNRQWPGGYDAQRDALEREVRSRLPGVRVQSLPVRVRPNAAAEVLPVLAGALERFRHAGRLLVNTSSGTPQMLEALKVLRGTGWFADGDVTLWQVDRPEFRVPGQAFWREATTPFLEETLRLGAAFAALRRFDFAGARDAFAALAAGPLELPGRSRTLLDLEHVADALWWLDARDAVSAAESLDALALHVPPLADLHGFAQSVEQAPAEVLIWLTWGRYDRAAAQERTADALVWAVALHELLVVKLAEQAGLPDTEKALRAQDLPSGLFDTLKAQVGPEGVNAQGHLKFMNLKEKLALLRAPALGVPNVDRFDAGDRRAVPNPQLAQVREWRNAVMHQGRVPADVDLNMVDEVVTALLGEYPFQTPWGKDWAGKPSAAFVSAVALQRLADELHGWAG